MWNGMHTDVYKACDNIIITCYQYLTSDILDLYLWDLWYNTLSGSPLTYDIYDTLLNHMTCLFLSFDTVFLFYYYEVNSGCWIQIMVIWDIWYIDEGFLIWIIPSTYQSHESIIWACTTSFVHTCIYRMLDISSHVYMCLCSRHYFLCMFSDLDLSI